MAPDRLYFAHLVEPVPEGRRHPHPPAHLTLVPPFVATIDAAREALGAALTGRRPFTVHATGPARFGPRGDIPVHLVGPVEELGYLHERLIAELARRGVGLVGDRHIHERFVPHIRIRPALPDFPRIGPGQVFVIDHVALLRSGDGLVLARAALPG